MGNPRLISAVLILLSALPGIWAWWPNKNQKVTLLLLLLLLGIVGIGWGPAQSRPFFLFFYLSALSWIGFAQRIGNVNPIQHLFPAFGTLSLIFFHLFEQFHFPGTKIWLGLAGLLFLTGLLVSIANIFKAGMLAKSWHCRIGKEYDWLLTVPITEMPCLWGIHIL